MSNSTVLAQIFPDIAQVPEMEMADRKPEVLYISGTERPITEIPTPIVGSRQTRTSGGNPDTDKSRQTSENQNADCKPENTMYIWNGKRCV